MTIPTSLQTGLRCRCPRCGEGPLLAGFLTLAPSCEACGLDYGFADPADGPAFFAMTAVGILVISVWAWWAVVASPPIWLQILMVFPALIGGCLAVLRPLKAWIVAEQFIHKAEQGRYASLGVHGEGDFAIDRRKAAER